MFKNTNYNADYIRAVKILKNRINTVEDLVRIWDFFGRCIEDHPEIEDIP